MKHYSVAIIGAGPAGLFASYYILNKSNKATVLLIDKGVETQKRICCSNCQLCPARERCNVLCGIGGSGLFSDGKLVLDLHSGGKLDAISSLTEEEKAEKARVMEIVLKDACSVPMEIMEKCCEAIELIVEFGAKGSKLAISDAGVGAAFCKAALKGASLNVYINTKSMADREYAEELNRKADAMLEKYTKIADDTFNSVLGRLK